MYMRIFSYTTYKNANNTTFAGEVVNVNPLKSVVPLILININLVYLTYLISITYIV